MPKMNLSKTQQFETVDEDQQLSSCYVQEKPTELFTTDWIYQWSKLSIK